MAQVRRSRSAHPGVSYVRRWKKGEQVVRARWQDPDSGKWCEFTFDTQDITTIEGRRTWMIEKSRALQQRRFALAKGAAPHTGETLKEAVESYFTTKGLRLKESTRDSYQAASDLLLEWAGLARLRLADELRADHLASFVEWLAVRPAKAAVKGGRRDERAPTDRSCSPTGVNSRLRSVKAIVNHLRRQGRLPHITSDDIKDRLKPLKTPKPRPSFLRAPQVRALVQAALRHDAAAFAMTRDEKSRGTKGGTAKNHPIAPFIAYMLMTGCRLEEALRVTWSAIDFEAKDERGRRVGEIVLGAEQVKTGHERAIDLGICPALKRILAAMKLKAGGAPYVFGGAEPWSRTIVERARRRLVDEFGAPEFTWSQTQGKKASLRATCGTYLTNSSVYASASPFHSARRLGHSVMIAERHYVGTLKGLPKKAKTLEAVLEIRKEIDEVVGRATGRADHPHPRASKLAARTGS